MIRLSLGYPDEENEVEMLRRKQKGNPLDSVKQITDGPGLELCRREVAAVHISDEVARYPFEVTPGFQSSAMRDIPALDPGEAQAGAAPTAVPSQKPTPVPTQAVKDVGEEVGATPGAEPVPSQAPGGQTGPGAGEGEEPGSSGVWYGVGLLLLPGKPGVFKRNCRRGNGRCLSCAGESDRWGADRFQKSADS